MAELPFPHCQEKELIWHKPFPFQALKNCQDNGILSRQLQKVKTFADCHDRTGKFKIDII